jgi:glycosyltransferase involved in cell wall biosynthesis
MRVALLTNFIPPYRLPLFEALQREVGELRVLVSARTEHGRSWDVNWGDLDVVQQRTISLRRTWRTSRFAEAYQMHIPVDTIPQLRRFRPDVILTGEMGARSLQAALYARMSRTPIVLWATLSDRIERERGPLRLAARKWLVRNVDRIIINGEDGARYFRRLGVADARMHKVPYVTDMSRLMQIPLSAGSGSTRELLFAGALSERKGIELLMAAVRALSDVERSRMRLTIIGDGPLRGWLDREVASVGLPVHVAGHVPYDQLPAWFARADVLVFPTLSDEWGLVVNEALAAGVPVLGSVYAQAVEVLVTDGKNGWTFAPDDVNEMTYALRRSLNVDGQTLTHMRQSARESVQHLTPEFAARRIAEVLTKARARE